ncbi:hypothetical protein TrCOL_g3522 [Triparma columacea]|uniref:Uncharacterized protein n=1 Tax=Triparma columacea TaxID=722753 RepID=A0A9W7L1T6_9STRA|nr:hypothetical protein TrCOL_g3522 [Triparma columacea]
MDKFPNSADSITIALTGHSSDNDDNSPPLSTKKEVSKAVKRKAAEVDSDEEFEFGEEEAGNRGGGKRRVLEESDEEEEEEMKVEEEKRVEKGKSKIQLMKEKKDVEKEEEGNKLFSIFTSKKVSSSTTMSTSSSALPSNVASSSPALSIPHAGFANGAMQPCWCDNKGCDGNVKRWPCNGTCCKGTGTLHSCKEMKWTKKSGKVQAYKSCKTKRAGNAVTNARWNPINSPIYAPLNNKQRHAAERKKRQAAQNVEETLRLASSSSIPIYTISQLKDHVRTFLNSPTFVALSLCVTFGYFYTAFAHRQEEERKTWAITTKSRTPPLQMVDSSSSSAKPTFIDLDLDHFNHVNLQCLDVFGCGSDNLEGFRHSAVGKVEAACHIAAWDKPWRAWQKVGGDNTGGSKDKGRRVVRFAYSTAPLGADFKWNVDREAKCAQKWEDL